METQNILKRAAEKTGLKRLRFNDKKVPTSVEDVVVFPFFGDHRASFVLSSLLLRRVKDELKSSKYLVVASWPGQEGLYPYADEYWQVEDESTLERLSGEAVGFSNNSQVPAIMTRTLNQYFYDVMSFGDLVPYYDNGFTREFFDRFKHIKFTLPSIPSSASLGSEISRSLGQRDRKVFLYPSKYSYSWRLSALSKTLVPKEFWLEAIETCSKSGFFPVVLSDFLSYDLSSDTERECLHMKNIDSLRVLSCIRACGCVVDIFNGISRYAIAARVPFICFDERGKFNALKEYEINDMCASNLHKEYVFGFSDVLNDDRSVWKSNIFDHLSIKLEKISENMNRDTWPSPAELNEIVPYDSVRKIKNKKLGTRFVKVEKL
jgi:hypothetical protein